MAANTDLYYDGDGVTAWGNKVNGLISGDSDSFDSVVKDIQTQVNSLIEEGVWQGGAAKQNYGYITDAYNATVDFMNGFKNNFMEAVEKANKALSQMEESNLAISMIATSKLNIQQTNKIGYLSQMNVDESKIKYAHGRIQEICTALDEDANELCSIEEKLRNTINTGLEGIWTGVDATNFTEAVVAFLDEHFDKYIDFFRHNVSNVRTADLNAQNH